MTAKSLGAPSRLYFNNYKETTKEAQNRFQLCDVPFQSSESRNKCSLNFSRTNFPSVSFGSGANVKDITPMASAIPPRALFRLE